MQYSIVGDGDNQFLTVFDPSYTKPGVMHSSHPNFDKVVDAIEAGVYVEETAFDPAEAAREAFEALGDRVTIKGSTVYLDGDPVDNSVTKAIVRWMQDGERDWNPLVRFFENIQGNPSEASREQLYSFLAANDYSLTRDGEIVGYKAVRELEDGSFQSINAGNPGDVQVNGEDAAARPVQQVGDTVTMARSKVDPSSAAYCSVGLHGATRSSRASS